MRTSHGLLLTPILAAHLLVVTAAHAGGPPGPFWGSAKKPPGKGLLAAARLGSPPETLSKRYPAARYRHYSIDLDQDGKRDFIAENKTEWETCFIRSDLSIAGCEKLNISLADGFSYMYFAPEAASGMLVLIDLTGDEDSSAYVLRRFDKATWKMDRGLPVIPLIDSRARGRKGIYWGFPWDIRSLPARVRDGKTEIRATFEHGIQDEGDAAPPARSVAILFDGIATQGDATGPYDRLRSKLDFVPLSNVLDMRQ